MGLGAIFISLSEAVSEIRQACEDAEAGSGYPFFFLVGAGISYPQVALASQITAACRTEAEKRDRTKAPLHGDAMSQYSHWFQSAYPQAIQRKKYLKSLIDNKPISRANFRLAHLLLGDEVDGKRERRPLTNLVVTTNFDDFLSKALHTFGKSHIICDHPETTMRVDLGDTGELFLVHVHGTYHFYDTKNLADEIKETSAHSDASPCTMAGLLDAILRDRSPLVVGYSGWENDVVMQSIKKRLATPLGYQLYWFCHQRATVESLPVFLRNNRHVTFVVPDESKQSSSVADDHKVFAEKLLPEGTESKTPRLDAYKVFESLNQDFRFPSPYITREPLKFLISQLAAKFPSEDLSAEGGTDIYSLSSVIQKIREADSYLEKSVASANSFKIQLEEMREAIRGSQFLAALEVGKTLDLAAVPQDSQEKLCEMFVDIGLGLKDQLDDELFAYDAALELATAIQQPAPHTLINIARALTYKAFVLGQLSRSEDAITVYDDVVNRYGAATEPALHEYVALSLFSKGFTLGQLNRSEKEITAYDEMVHRYGTATEPALRAYVARALFNKGIKLGDLNRNDDAIAVFDEVVKRYGTATEPALRELVALALVNKGITLGQLKLEDAIAVFDEVVKRYSTATEPALREQVARSLVNKGITLDQLKRSEAAIAVYDEVENRYGTATEPALREWVARALLGKGITLYELNRSEEATAAHDELVNRYGTATELALRELVAEALKFRKI